MVSDHSCEWRFATSQVSMLIEASAYQERFCQTSCKFTGVSGEAIRVNLYSVISVVCASEDLCMAHLEVRIRSHM